VCVRRLVFFMSFSSNAYLEDYKANPASLIDSIETGNVVVYV
jgi:hypothetical protein